MLIICHFPCSRIVRPRRRPPALAAWCPILRGSSRPGCSLRRAGSCGPRRPQRRPATSTPRTTGRESTSAISGPGPTAPLPLPRNQMAKPSWSVGPMSATQAAINSWSCATTSTVRWTIRSARMVSILRTSQPGQTMAMALRCTRTLEPLTTARSSLSDTDTEPLGTSLCSATTPTARLTRVSMTTAKCFSTLARR